MEDKENGQMHTLSRILKLWRVHAWLDFIFATRSLRLFAINYISDGVLSIASVSSTLLLAARFDGIGPWRLPQILFMLGYAMTVTGLLSTLFGYNVLYIGRRLGRGQLDHTLIQPQPIWMALLTEGFNPFLGSISLLTGIVMLWWGFNQLQQPASIGWVITLLISLVASAVVMLAFNFIWGSLAFWAPRGAEEINSPLIDMFAQLKGYPLDGLGSLMMGGLLIALPVGFVAWLPCRALLGLTDQPLDVLATPLAALFFSALAILIFRRGLRHYMQVGSRRYHDMGHRR